MGLLIRKGYLAHPQILIGAIGDATCDTTPLQVGQFESGIEIDEDLGRLFLEGGGGGQLTESYELALYFMARHTALDSFEKRGRRGYIFLIGDETPYRRVKRKEVEKHIGDRLPQDVPVEDVIAELQRMYNVYYILPNMTSNWNNEVVHSRWVELLGQNVLRLEDPAGISELIASTIGIAEGRRGPGRFGRRPSGGRRGEGGRPGDRQGAGPRRRKAMKQVIITVGLGFGDEGKGAVVDALTRRVGADLVVRYCGGSQAGHNVQLPDGRRHTFSQFGAGTLAPERPRTYLGPAVVIDPPAILREADHLEELGIADATELLTVHPRCLVATFWHRALNQIREVSRKGKRHGSCGQGIGEARRYWLRYGQDAIFAADLADVAILRDKLELQRQRTLLALQHFVDRIDRDFLRDIDLWERSAADEARDLSEAIREGVTISAETPDYDTAIFEGAQGVLLDEYRGFHPHTTWSTVTTHHAWELVEQMEAEAVAVLGITRAYTTRHGEGPLPTFSPELTARLRDPGNPWNRWQGTMRCGWLDLPLLRYAAAAAGPLDGIVVNHLDRVTDGGAMDL